MGFETALHEHHEGRNIAVTATDLRDFRPNEGSHLAMRLDVALLKANALKPGGFLFPREVRNEVLGKTGK